MATTTTTDEDAALLTTTTLIQEYILAITPKITASLSIPCSMMLLYEVTMELYFGKQQQSPFSIVSTATVGGSTRSIRSNRSSRSTRSNRSNRSSSRSLGVGAGNGSSNPTILRVLMGMSFVDILSSSAWFMSTWMVPSESGFALSGRGNRSTCTYQGFFLQFAIGAPMYNCSLAMFYLLVIKYRYTRYQLVQLERYVHTFILSFCIGTGILLIPLEQYNHIGAVCWVIGQPHDCGHSTYRSGGGDSDKGHNDFAPCERGDYAYIYGLALFYGPLWLCVIMCVVCMIMIVRHVRQTLSRLVRHNRQGNGTSITLSRRNMDNTERVMTQAILYGLSFLITWVPSTMWSMGHWFSFKNAFYLDLIASIFEPMQGLLNYMVYRRTQRSSTSRNDDDNDGNEGCCSCEALKRLLTLSKSSTAPPSSSTASVAAVADGGRANEPSPIFDYSERTESTPEAAAAAMVMVKAAFPSSIHNDDDDHSRDIHDGNVDSNVPAFVLERDAEPDDEMGCSGSEFDNDPRQQHKEFHDDGVEPSAELFQQEHSDERPGRVDSQFA